MMQALWTTGYTHPSRVSSTERRLWMNEGQIASLENKE